MSGALFEEQADSLAIQDLPLHIPDKGALIHVAIRTNALATLRPHLPVSLSLYRRLQFGRFFEETKLLTNLSLDRQQLDQPNPESTGQSDEPWLIAFVDRSCRPETEVWVFCSWESGAHKYNTRNNNSTSSSLALPPGGKEERLLRNLLAAMKALPIPISIHQDVLDAKTTQLDNDSTKDSVGLSRDDYASHMLDPNIMLWGATHERTLPLLQQLGVAGGERFKAAATPNLMFTWDVDALAEERELPEGLLWGELKQSHFALVRSRTQIPRQDRTLAILPNIGIFPDVPHPQQAHRKPIAWVFVGLDASLTTLHVEPEWRGRGLAKAITKKLFREKMGLFWEDGVTKWAHGYVIRGNKESEGMCRSLNGSSDWDVYWVRVDLSRV